MPSTLGRATEASVKASLGLMSMEVSLYTGDRKEGKKAASFRNCCPTCYKDKNEAALLHNESFCEEGHGPFTQDEMVKGAETDEGLKIVGTTEEVKDEKSAAIGLEKKQMELEFLLAEDFFGNFFPADKTWILQPTAKNAFFTALLSLVGTDGLIKGIDGGPRVVLGTVRVRDNEHLFMLRRWDDQLVANTLVRPSDRKVFPAPLEAEVSDKNVTMLRTLIGLETVDFDADKFDDQARARIKAWKEARSGGAAVTVPAAGTKAADPDAAMAAMLEAAVAAAKEKAKSA